jgi:hypothetical protein
MSRRAASLCVALTTWALAGQAMAEENPFLSQARVFYRGLEFEKCIQRLQKASEASSTQRELADIEIFLGLCKASTARASETAEHFKLALQLDSTVTLPDLSPPRLVRQFEEARKKHIALYGETPPPQVAKPVVTPTPPVAAAPPTATQVIQEPPRAKSKLPSYILIGTGAAAIAGGAIVGVWANGTAAAARASVDPVLKPQLRDAATTRALVADISMVAGAIAAGTGAFLLFTRSKDSPAPAVSLGPSSVSLTWSLD